MALTKWTPFEMWDPFREMRSLQERMSRLFESSFGRPSHAEGLLTDGWFPAVDIHEDGNNIYLKAEIPGVRKDDLNISLDNNILTIKGEKKQESEVNEENYHRMERYYGSFSRSFTLPASVDSAKVAAVYKDGILTLTLPKKEEAKPKKIDVKVS